MMGSQEAQSKIRKAYLEKCAAVSDTKRDIGNRASARRNTSPWIRQSQIFNPLYVEATDDMEENERFALDDMVQKVHEMDIELKYIRKSIANSLSNLNNLDEDSINCQRDENEEYGEGNVYWERNSLLDEVPKDTRDSDEEEESQDREKRIKRPKEMPLVDEEHQLHNYEEKYTGNVFLVYV